MRRFLTYVAAVTAATVSIMVQTPAVIWADTEVQTEAAAETDTETISQTIASNYTKKKIKTQTASEGKAADNNIEAAAEETAKTEEETAAEEAEKAAEYNADLRQHLVNYAVQFVGNPYRAGGNDPHTGADCSGFVRYVMQHAAGISMNRTSRDQATQGKSISAAQMQPGDLLFYGNGSKINHVAMYIGDGRIVHASTEKTGIKTSIWNYRTPVRIVSMLG